MVNRKEFKSWLISKKPDKNVKQIIDTVSRVGKIENEYAKIWEGFSLDDEYRKDKGQQILDDFSKAGRALKEKGIALPFGTKQLYPYKSSLVRYFEYCKERNE